ncbi:aldose 1-epimerase family protein [Hydrotalea sp.]|uniref:aldose 1-epimerase family protein n=1 Tax=Hydrotalea sp. TaxID=2881279 RepID=UPI0026188117|nr:aldose 1-epimerase family protein [Hydrotalea sp.]
MAVYTINNSILQVQIADKGAELQCIYHTENQIDYLWNGDTAFWAKKSPVLFPIVGGLKQNTYYYNEKAYYLNRHGFARDMVFKVQQQTDNAIQLVLTDSPETLQVYPFRFVFTIQYTIVTNCLMVEYTVENIDSVNMYFSLGAHPAFAVPLTADTVYEDYFLQFSQTENAGIWPLTDGGLLQEVPVPFLQNSPTIALHKSLFYKDALVFKHLHSESVRLHNTKNKHGINLQFPDFPYLGIWAAKDADFVCIEPWCGVADSNHSNQQLVQKEGIRVLVPHTKFIRSWNVAVY